MSIVLHFDWTTRGHGPCSFQMRGRGLAFLGGKMEGSFFRCKISIKHFNNNKMQRYHRISIIFLSSQFSSAAFKEPSRLHSEYVGFPHDVESIDSSISHVLNMSTHQKWYYKYFKTSIWIFFLGLNHQPWGQRSTLNLTWATEHVKSLTVKRRIHSELFLIECVCILREGSWDSSFISKKISKYELCRCFIEWNVIPPSPPPRPPL